MSIQFNHTIIRARDKHASARFLATILDLPIGDEFGPFIPIHSFLVDDAEFDAAFTRIQDQNLTYYAEPGGGQPGHINHHWGGRGVYFNDPDLHAMELLTRAP